MNDPSAVQIDQHLGSGHGSASPEQKAQESADQCVPYAATVEKMARNDCN